MSLTVQHLTKIYGTQKAVNNITFSVSRGEIVGFLGPNGAGKSTTMKIATSYLPPTGGRVLVEGYDSAAQPMEVKKVIGYLAEHNPLYLDLYVHEYLNFAGKLYGMKGESLKKRVKEMVDRCGLGSEQNKKIESLSKGYRQRVGLAQALLHDPTVLILDEPTSGLDPNQILEIRSLIKDVSKDKTVIFSTHIMQEVEALCDRVVVINKGELVADDTLQNLKQNSSSSACVIIDFEVAVDEAMLSQLKGIQRVEKIESGAQHRYRLFANANVDVRPEIFRFAADKNLSLIGLKQEEGSLENVFHSLTQTPKEFIE
jgi:ABC-2 type transport system ATP-binding protein